MGLDTLDETKPYDTDLVSFGDDEIRQTRLATKQSFGNEHHLVGPHKFLLGPAASRPAPGFVGRLYINTTTRNIEYDNGSAWLASQFDAGQVIVTTNTQISPYGTLWAQSVPTGSDLGDPLDTNVEQVQAEVTWPSRGGPWLTWATIGGQYPVTVGPTPKAPRIVFRLRLNSPAGVATGGSILQAYVMRLGKLDAVAGSPATSFILEFPFSASLIHGGGSLSPPPSNTGPATHRLTLTSQAMDYVVDAGGPPTVNSRRIIVMEQA